MEALDFDEAERAQAEPDAFIDLVENVSRATSLATMLDTVAAEFGVSSHALRGECRDRFLAHPRQVFCWLARQAGKSSSVTGRFIFRDHTTVLYAEAMTHLRMEKDAALAARLKNLAARLNVKTFQRPNFGKCVRRNLGEAGE